MALAIPISLQTLIVVGVNVADTLMLAELSEAQVSAASLAGSYMSLITILSMGIGFGANVMASQYWGAKDMASFKKTVALVMRISIVLGILVSVITMLFPSQIMSLYTDDVAVVEYGATYMSYIDAALFFQILSQPLSYVIRSAGKTKISLYSTLGAFFINIVINYIFIFGKFGAPAMEIAGAALGTLVSYIFQCIYVLVSVYVFEKDLKCRISDIVRPLDGMEKVFIKYSLPVIVSDMMVGLGINVTSIIMGHIGSYYVAAEAVVGTLMRLLQSFSNGMANSSSVIVGRSVGRGEKELAGRQSISCVVFSAIFGIVLAIFVLIAGRYYVDIYNLTDDTRQTAYTMIYAAAPTTIFMITSSVLTKGVLRGGGDTKFLMFCDIFFQWCISIPLGALAGLVFKWPVFWIYLCIYSERFIRTAVASVRLAGKKWIQSLNYDNN